MKKGSGEERFTDDWIKEKAIQKDQSILYSTDTTLLLDIDTDEDFEAFKTNFSIISDHIDGFPKGYRVLASKNGRRHVVVTMLVEVDIVSRIMFQAFLGSDRKRELLSYIGLQKGQTNPVVLFRPKDEELDEEVTL